MKGKTTAEQIQIINSVLWIALALLTVMVLIGSNPAFAANGKRYPGTMCQLGPFGSLSDTKYNSTGGVFNDSSLGSLLFVCPIVRENIVSNSGIAFASVTIKKESDAVVICELFSLNTAGTVVSRKTVYSSGYAGRLHSLDFGPQSGVNNGFYVLSCYIPPMVSGSQTGILYLSLG